MGLTFNNIHLRISGAFRPDAFVTRLTTGKGLTPVESIEEADARILVLKQPDSQWVTIASDLFDMDPDTADRMSRDLAQAFGTPVLVVGCFDSDYLYLNLVDPAHSVDAWAATGRFPGEHAPRRSNFSAWKPYVTDVSALRQVMQKHYVFAEECLEGLTDILSLPVSQSGRCMDSAAPASGVRRFRCRLTEASEPGKPPVFTCGSHPSTSGAGTKGLLASM